jgi:hypothetical protein
MQLGKTANIFLVERSVKAVSDYRCKVRIIHDKVITVNAKNKKEAEEEAKYLCQNGWGLILEKRGEVLEMERMTEKKKAQERERTRS